MSGARLIARLARASARPAHNGFCSPAVTVLQVRRFKTTDRTTVDQSSLSGFKGVIDLDNDDEDVRFNDTRPQVRNRGRPLKPQLVPDDVRRALDDDGSDNEAEELPLAVHRSGKRNEYGGDGEERIIVDGPIEDRVEQLSRLVAAGGIRRRSEIAQHDIAYSALGVCGTWPDPCRGEQTRVNEPFRCKGPD